MLDLDDDLDWRFHIEVIFPELEPDLAEHWNRWQRYRSENRKMFDRIDAQLLEEHLNIAMTWQS